MLQTLGGTDTQGKVRSANKDMNAEGDEESPLGDQKPTVSTEWSGWSRAHPPEPFDLDAHLHWP